VCANLGWVGQIGRCLVVRLFACGAPAVGWWPRSSGGWIRRVAVIGSRSSGEVLAVIVSDQMIARRSVGAIVWARF